LHKINKNSKTINSLANDLFVSFLYFLIFAHNVESDCFEKGEKPVGAGNPGK
jgi:hypothetical protein